MPTCKNCHRKWSWWQTLKKCLSFRIGMTCPYCNEKQYFSGRYRMSGTIIPVVTSPLVIFMGIYFGYSYISLLIAISVILAIFAINPFFIESSNEEEPLL